MKKTLSFSVALFALLAAYLVLWPVPIDPVAWDAPVSDGLIDPFGYDERLAAARGIDLGDVDGPEDAALGVDNLVYVTTPGGAILSVSNSGRVSTFADAGGRPLGIATNPDGSFTVANAHVGLQRVSRDGEVATILDTIDGLPIVAANNVAVASDGVIYFSESSTKFGTREFAGSYKASLLDLMEHGGHGRVIEFDPAAGSARVLVTGINYANGVAISEDDDYLLIAETGHYRILRYWLRGPRSGTHEVIIENLPGFPDNITAGLQGRFWIGLAAPRSDLLDRLSDKPFLRKVIQRLPALFRPKAVPSAHVIAITGDGQVLMNLQDPSARFPSMTGVLETRNALYLTRLFGRHLPRLAKRDLL